MIKPVNDFLIDVACFGNHDFVLNYIFHSKKLKDLDFDVLTDYVEKTNFPWVLSNVKTRSDFQPLAGGKETHIIEKKGLKVKLMNIVYSI